MTEASAWRRQRPVDRLDRGAERAEADDILDMAGQQQLLGHVEDEQRLHAVIGEPLPGLGEGEVAEALGMAEEGAVGPQGVRRRRRCSTTSR
jgi:hypothetical protein